LGFHEEIVTGSLGFVGCFKTLQESAMSATETKIDLLWSDIFFNCKIGPDVRYDGKQDVEAEMERGAREFLEAFPQCPYSADELIADYESRL